MKKKIQGRVNVWLYNTITGKCLEEARTGVIEYEPGNTVQKRDALASVIVELLDNPRVYLEVVPDEGKVIAGRELKRLYAIFSLESEERARAAA